MGQHFLRFGINWDGWNFKAGLGWHPVVPLFAFLLLKFERNTPDWALLEAAHQVGDVAGNFVAHALGRDGRDLLADALVILEIKAKLAIEALDNKPRSTLSGLGADTTHV